MWENVAVLMSSIGWTWYGILTYFLGCLALALLGVVLMSHFHLGFFPILLAGAVGLTLFIGWQVGSTTLELQGKGVGSLEIAVLNTVPWICLVAICAGGIGYSLPRRKEK